jgi:hypothetical protein
LWGAATYVAIQHIGWGDALTLTAGSVAYVVSTGLVLLSVHRRALRRTISAAVEIFVPSRAVKSDGSSHR